MLHYPLQSLTLTTHGICTVENRKMYERRIYSFYFQQFHDDIMQVLCFFRLSKFKHSQKPFLNFVWSNVHKMNKYSHLWTVSFVHTFVCRNRQILLLPVHLWQVVRFWSVFSMWSLMSSTPMSDRKFIMSSKSFLTAHFCFAINKLFLGISLLKFYFFFCLFQFYFPFLSSADALRFLWKTLFSALAYF